MAVDGQDDASAFDIGAVHAETREGAKHLAAVVGGYARSFVAVIESAQVRWHRLNYDDTDAALVRQRLHQCHALLQHLRRNQRLHDRLHMARLDFREIGNVVAPS